MKNFNATRVDLEPRDKINTGLMLIRYREIAVVKLEHDELDDYAASFVRNLRNWDETDLQDLTEKQHRYLQRITEGKMGLK